MTTLTLCVPFYRSLPFMARYLESVAGLPPERVRFVFVDDGSTDDAHVLVEEFRASRPGVRLIRFAENRGGGPAFNAAMDVADGDYLMRHDPDDIPLRSGLMEALELAGRSGADVVLQPWIRVRVDGTESVARRVPAGGKTKWWLDVPPAPWVTMARRSLARECGVVFPPVPSAGDSLWFLHLMAVADPARVVASGEPSYRYLLRAGSQGDESDGRTAYHLEVHAALTKEREHLLARLRREGLISEADLRHGMRRGWGRRLGLLLKAGRRAEVLSLYREASRKWGASWRMRRDALRAWLGVR